MIATDPLSVLFIVCFLIGLVYFIVAAFLGNLGHGFAHGAAHHVDIGHHGGGIHATGTHTTHAVGHGPAHASGHVTSSHATAHASSQGHHQSLMSIVNPTSIMLFLFGFGFFGYLFHTTVHFVAALTLVLAGIGGIAISVLPLITLSRPFARRVATTVQAFSYPTGLLRKAT